MASADPTPIDAAKQAVEWDPNPDTRSATEELIKSNNEDELSKLFGSRLQFGTAGLRGPMGPGSSRMNDLTVLQAAQGLCAYLEAQFPDAKDRGVVIGYDHRTHGSLNSERFATLSALTFLMRGFTVHLYDGLVATPMVPWGVDSVKAVAGIMVTASHNPKADNGYKVYWANGCQIIPPHDKGIAQAILDNLEPWDKAAYQSATYESVRAHDRCHNPNDLKKAYVDRVSSALCRHRADNGSNPPVCYTAMHGVGTPFVQDTFEAFGLPAFVPTSAQIEPDPEFPTVAFPNPEEGKGALKLAMEAAEAGGATLILANDPDADRLAVAERGGDGSWRIFTGNEIADLLAHWEWTTWRAANPAADPSKVYMVASTVSSKMLGAMARKEGFRFEETLTGFKWMGNRSMQLRDDGNTVLFSFEEAIGFCIGDIDKDGVSAAAVFAEMAGALARRGQTVTQHLEHLYQTYGYFMTNNRYLFVDDPAKSILICDRLRNDGHYWLMLGRWRITAIRDLTSPGRDTEADDLKPSLPTSSSSQMITYKFSNGAVATLRTSGTEPKLKYYVEMAGEDPDATRSELDELVETLIDQMLQPDVHGLTRPSD